MTAQGPHGMLPARDHDEALRERCVATMRRYFTAELVPGNRRLYDHRLLPGFIAREGRPPETGKEVQALLEPTFYYRASSLFGRATQELLWDTVGETIDRQLPALVERARPGADALGTLVIPAEIDLPDYVTGVDIHVMPGSFHTELVEDDVFAGALYDSGGFTFAYGSRGPYNENLGRLVVAMLKARFPDFRPRRILEMGCGAGASTLPLKEGWPEAEVHAIDIGAPMVRYAHARAESLGVPIHFSQQDAAHTDFPDGHFDLVLSIIVNHEMPLKVIQAMMRECYRLLAPGGITLHDGWLPGDRPPADAYQQFMSQWFARHNNEPFGKGYDPVRDFTAAGFAREDMFSGTPRGDDYLKGQLAAHSYVGAVKR